jgi:hypothetical protein|tara:strand:+ start:434 stop:637 length:204 start_codon:yes stop_codon:yes gene_type:complete
MLTITNHLTAFWTVVVMNCIQPVNWQYCYRIDEWLLPDLRQGIEIYLDRNLDFLYKEERKYLDSVVE